ncbi:PREDICTED: probable pre-mRNA-splicing factor ATP-dependent RNA helicase DEAH3 [Camelina sativa]|uniref:RNA helicase n=1 Tax=Camelina sativa TaxID=90675 RepID=A0ABM0ZFZ3_CAMSA|nr:PREDICTED: probable pre-mRNA-splicing factor ATP-dependent RNA helicase DEAH3 [Camelina sativa]
MVNSARYLEIQEERRNLPVWVHKDEFLQALKENQMVILVGDTGSGKTTQIPQFVLEALVNENPNPGGTGRLVVGCTQPCRVAAMSAARRVAEEMDAVIGEEVGCTVRFDDCSSSRTVLKYLTDGMLLREALVDPLLSNYKAIILDEAHERSIATDLLFGILVKALTSRPTLKLVVMSSTLYAHKLRYYFGGHVPLIKVPGRLHPVEIIYTQEPVTHYLEAAIRKVIQIHMCEPPGDVLVFLTGEEEIEDACSRILHKLGDQVKVVPLYSFLPPAMQQRAFDPTPHPVRKIVVSTNIAETSLSIDGIVYVVDPGFSMQKYYNPKTRLDSLVVSPISMASADQRARRAGTTGPGKCFRLYTQEIYSGLIPLEVPEMYRANLVNTVLALKRLGVKDLLSLNFMDPPFPKTLFQALTDLFDLGAVDDEGNLTKIGEMMSLEV